MKEKTTLRELKQFQLMDLRAIKEYLEERALKGWKIKSIGIFYTFEKIEPKKLIYSVEVFEKASVNDTTPQGKTKNYVAFCESAGWKHVCSSGMLNIFVTEDENAVPIHTDESIRYQSVKKGIIKQNIIFYCALMFLIAFYAYKSGNWTTFFSNDISTFELINIMLFFFSMVISITSIIRIRVWSTKAKKCLKNGEPVEYIGTKGNKRYSNVVKAVWILETIVFSAFALSKILLAEYEVAAVIFSIGIAIAMYFGLTQIVIENKLRRKANVKWYILIAIGCLLLSSVLAILIVVLL